MLATGGSACKAIEILLAHGVLEENIVFVNFVASQHGLQVLTSSFPKLTLVTAAVDADLNKNK